MRGKNNNTNIVSTPRNYETYDRGQPLKLSNASQGQKDFFTRGYCHLFALSMNQRHGWEIRALGSPADEYSMMPWNGLGGVPRHVYCIDKHGHAIDALGVFENEAAIRKYYQHQDIPDEELISVAVDAQMIPDLQKHGYLYYTSKDVKIADKVVKKLKLEKLLQTL